MSMDADVSDRPFPCSGGLDAPFKINLQSNNDGSREPHAFHKPAFLTTADSTPNIIQHCPIISPSSIPNPNPSASAANPPENYSMYGGYLYSIPGYSAFQPLPYPSLGLMGQNTAQTVPVSMQNEPPPTTDYIQLTSSSSATSSVIEPKPPEEHSTLVEIGRNPLENRYPKILEAGKPETDFEEQFTPEIIPTVIETNNDSLIRITSLAQSSGSTISLSKNEQPCLPESKKKIPERFSLKTSIPISKIDMKCVSNLPDLSYQTTLAKLDSNVTLNMPVKFPKPPDLQKIEIHSNIVIKSGANVPTHMAINEGLPSQPEPVLTNSVSTNNMATLINAVESLSKGDKLWPPDQAEDASQPPSVEPHNQVLTPVAIRATCIPSNITLPMESMTYPNSTADNSQADQKNQIVFIQNKNANSKLLLTISQQQPSVGSMVLQKNVLPEPKNLPAPSRVSSLSKKSKESVPIAEATRAQPAGKVVALKRLHQDNGDEDDFENLITENQIYGNKIVVKEKSQGTLQEQEIRTKNLSLSKTDNVELQSERKNLFIQPNFLYVSNVQFPNLMMIKNGAKINASIQEPSKKENKITVEISTPGNTDVYGALRNTKTPQTLQLNKDFHVLKTSNNIIHSISNKQNANPPELLLQSGNQKVIMNPQIVYQVPMLENLQNNIQKTCYNSGGNRELSTFINTQQANNACSQTSGDSTEKINDKLFISCPGKQDNINHTKIVIPKLRPQSTIVKEDIVSSLDLAEKRKRLRRLKYLAKRDPKEVKIDSHKTKTEPANTIVTATEIKKEIHNEFLKSRHLFENDSSDSDSDFDVEELADYANVIKLYGPSADPPVDIKINFFKAVGLTTNDERKEKETELLEKVLRMDSVASACISIGRLDCIHAPLMAVARRAEPRRSVAVRARAPPPRAPDTDRSEERLRHKFVFMAQLELGGVSPQFKEGYEKVWQEIIKDRKRRNGETAFTKYCEQSYAEQQRAKEKKADESIDLNATSLSALQIMTEIKKSVLENNNVIRKRLDGQNETEHTSTTDFSNIQSLAEKSFTELGRLSRMADRSVKIFSGQDAILSAPNRVHSHVRVATVSSLTNQEILAKPLIPEPVNITNIPPVNCQIPKITIPSVTKVISLTSIQDPSAVNTSPATSMDEPQNSAAGAKTETLVVLGGDRKESENNAAACNTTPAACQVVDLPVAQSTFLEWPGLDAITQSYQRYNAACRTEIGHLIKETSRLRQEALERRREIAASNEAIRRLFNEKNSLSAQEIETKQSIDKILQCINIIKGI